MAPKKPGMTPNQEQQPKAKGFAVTLPDINDYGIWLWALPTASFTLKNGVVTAWFQPFVETEDIKEE